MTEKFKLTKPLAFKRHCEQKLNSILNEPKFLLFVAMSHHPKSWMIADVNSQLFFAEFNSQTGELVSLIMTQDPEEYLSDQYMELTDDFENYSNALEYKNHISYIEHYYAKGYFVKECRHD